MEHPQPGTKLTWVVSLSLITTFCPNHSLLHKQAENLIDFSLSSSFGAKTPQGGGRAVQTLGWVLHSKQEGCCRNYSKPSCWKQAWVRMVSWQPQRWEWGKEMGLEASASPNPFMSISKPRWEHPDLVSRMGTPRSALWCCPKRWGVGGENTLCLHAVSTAGSFHQKLSLVSNQKSVRVPQELQQEEEEEEEEGRQAAFAWPQHQDFGHKSGFFKSQQLQRVFRIWETRPSNWKGIQLFKLRLGLCLYLFCL